MLAAAICEEDKRDALGLEVGQRLVGARERVGASYEDAIDTLDILEVVMREEWYACLTQKRMRIQVYVKEG